MKKTITREEAARHCHRRTREVAEMEEVLESFLLSFSTATDTLGVPLLKEEMTSIWEEQTPHQVPSRSSRCVPLHCNWRDQEGRREFTITSLCKRVHIMSLESFHSHSVHSLIMGCSFQVPPPVPSIFKLTCLMVLFESRSRASMAQQHQTLRTFDHEMQSRLNALSQAVHGTDVFPLYSPPAQYTGELLGVQYLFYQTGRMLFTDGEEMEKDINEGFGDIKDTSESLQPECQFDKDLCTFSLPTEEEENDSDEQVIYM